jgi:hypothetical protein
MSLVCEYTISCFSRILFTCFPIIEEFLQGPEHWEHQRAISVLPTGRAIPVGVGILHPNVYQSGGDKGRGLSVICAYHEKVMAAEKVANKPYAWLVDVQDILLSESKL